MKRINNFLILLLAVSLFAVTAGKAQQLVVREKPVAPKSNNRLVTHTKYDIWIADDWLVDDGKYICRAGHWATPMATGEKWKAGYWQKVANGYTWVMGGWILPHDQRVK